MTRGPHRSESSRRAILESAGELLVRNGWSGLTIEGIAGHAGVGKQTIYRWWPSKSAVLADALSEGALLPALHDTPDTGEVLADVTAWLTEVAEVLGKPGRSDLVRSLLGAAVENEQVAAALSERLGAAPHAVAGRLTTAVESDELPAGTPVQLLTEALIGAVLLRVLSREPFDADDALLLSAAVLGAAARGPAPDGH